jgi:hypothetical protein
MEHLRLGLQCFKEAILILIFRVRYSSNNALLSTDGTCRNFLAAKRVHADLSLRRALELAMDSWEASLWRGVR